MGIVEEFGKFGNTFGIGVSLELEALAFEESSELFVIGDNTVVNNDEF